MYHYSASSTDLVGNAAVNDNGGAYFHFETLGDFGQGLQACHEGRIFVDAPTVACDSSMGVTVGDQDLNLDPGAIETVTIARPGRTRRRSPARSRRRARRRSPATASCRWSTATC